jgi:hypothetical protein
MSILHGLARVLSFLTFGCLWVAQVYYWNDWWGPIGLYLGLGAIPVGLTLPVVYLFQTGFFSYILFGLLGAFITALIVAARTERRW